MDGDLRGRIHANVRKKTRDSSVYDSCSSMRPSIQNLTQEFTAVVFEKDQLEIRDMSELNLFLPPLAYQYSDSDVEAKLWDTWKRTVCFR